MNHQPITYELSTLADTESMAQRVAEHLTAPLAMALVGTLGSGKTQWTRFLLAKLGIAKEQVTSPTYVLQHTYLGPWPIHHFDFYRLESVAQVWDLGIDELYEQRCLVIIEWADKFPECLPDDCLTIEFIETSHGGRTATLSASGPRATRLLQRLSSG
ncbi:MAG: tRNA (adenosine(37)-N6)-threonylcarbamoyltransferase complex ATPase subunit type 1 TsaE [Pirellulaceae bacterium]|jgi:tRNA threonylcarbamoyladenosine biosynthesis protein TsaE|nr:tRNA (adenosine(37)-N6)-threonylcarbamoyltransferase complex ATPase subunit type 1 TsaE [Pirellulaceae bacterium]